MKNNLSAKILSSLTIAALTLILASGCQNTKPAPAEDPTVTMEPVANITPQQQMALPAPVLDRDIQWTQILTADFNQQEHSLMVILQVKDGRMDLIGLTPSGVKLFESGYDGTQIKAQSYIETNLPPVNQVMLDIMLAVWPPETIEEDLPENFTLREGGGSREIYDADGFELYQISYEKDGAERPLQINNLNLGYTISLKYL